MQGGIDGAPPAAVACAEPEACNRFIGNSMDVNANSGVVNVRGESVESVSAHVTLQGTRIEGNTGRRLFDVSDALLDLDGARARLDHLLGQQVRRLGIAEARVDVGDDRDDVGLIAVDLRLDELRRGVITCRAGGVEPGEQQVELAGVGLTEERVQLLDQRGDGRLLVHRLIGQRTELGAQRRHHPAGEVQVALVRRLQVLLDRDELLLPDEAVPNAERLGVDRGVGVVLVHIAAHDVGGVLRDLEPGAEAVLRPHPRGRLGVDGVPAGAVLLLEGPDGVDVVLVGGHVRSFAMGGGEGCHVSRSRRGTSCRRAR